MVRKIGCLLVALAVLLPLVPLSAQRVGVVMSGGGAKGLYHIGVLEALEESGVPIDYVAGTSMGSIIAAMYASGYSPAEMRALVASEVVKEWVSGRIDPVRYTPYYRQIGAQPGFVSVRLNLDRSKGKKLFTSPNLISSTQIDMAFTELFAPANVASGGDFDRLMIPFLCVAADMNARKPVVMRQGDLGEAVRSSMSIPLVFKPVKLDSMLLYDGGIYDNYPWKPLDEAFAPDFLVGSICTAGNAPPSEKSNLMDQAFMLAMQQTDYTMPSWKSATIRRAVEVSMLDFDKAEEIMDMGYSDAMQQMPDLLARISRRMSGEEYEARRKAFRERSPELIFNDYQLQGVGKGTEEYIREHAQMKSRNKKQPQRAMTFDELRQNLFSVLTSGDLTMDYPHVRYDSLSKGYSFQTHLTTKPNFKITIGGNISSTAFNQAYIGVNYEHLGRVSQQVGVNLYLGPLYTWGTLSGRTLFHVRTPLFLDYSYNFSYTNFRHGTFGHVTPVDNTVSIKQNANFGSLMAGMPLTLRSALTLRTNGGLINYHTPSPSTSPSPSPSTEATGSDHTRFSFFSAKVEVARNTLDKVLYPRKGSDLSLSAIYVTGRDKFRKADEKEFLSKTNRQWFGARFALSQYFDIPACKWFSLGFNVDAVWVDHPGFTSPSASLLSLPEYAPVTHARMIYMPDFRAERFVAGGVMPTFDILPNLFVRPSFYAMYRNRRNFLAPEVTRRPDEQWHYIAELSVVYHTPIGPASLALTKYDLNSWNNMYLTFNFGYKLFAPKGTFY